MFKVQADSLDEYFDADLTRKEDLQALDALICRTVPGLERWFYPGAPDGAPGMRMNLIGYGCFQYEVKSGQRAQWPIIGLALQKNYISLYTSVVQDGAPITDFTSSTRTRSSHCSRTSIRHSGRTPSEPCSTGRTASCRRR